MRNKERKRRGSGYKIVSIIVDGETEKWYLQMLRKNEDLKKLRIEPELPKRKKLKDLFYMVTENRKDYDLVIWIVDFDTIIKEEREKKKVGQSPLNEFRKILDKLQTFENVKVLVNNPCLEYWYLQHMKETSRYYNQCGQITKEFSGVLSDYEKSEKYYKKESNDIYKKLMPYKNSAIKNSTKLGLFDINDYKKGKAEMYKIFELLEILREKQSNYTYSTKS